MSLDILDESEKSPKPPNRKTQMNGWECLFGICSRLITSGYGVAVLLGIVFVICVIGVFGGMESADKKDTILAILGWRAFAITGWLLAVVILIAAQKILRFSAASYENQLRLAKENKEAALRIHEKLPLPDSERKS